MVHTLLFRASAGAMESDEALSAKELAHFAHAVANVTRARKTGVDTAVVLKEKLSAGLDQVAKDVAKEKLTPAEVLERARAIVRGEI
jgi:hypothetical protein